MEEYLKEYRKTDLTMSQRNIKKMMSLKELKWMWQPNYQR